MTNEEPTVGLSALVPVSGNDLSTLEDLLVSFDAQTDEDFELLLLVDATTGDPARVQGVLNQFSESLIAKSSLHPLGESDLAGLLNLGIDHSVGQLIVPVPPDAVLFSCWSEELRQARVSDPSKIARVRGVSQAFSKAPWPNGAPGYVATGGSISLPLEEFDVAGLAVVHAMPIGTYGLPRLQLDRYGYRYERNLGGATAWQLLACLALRCGVTSPSSEACILFRDWHPNSGASRSSRVLSQLLVQAPAVLPTSVLEILAQEQELADELRATNEQLSLELSTERLRIDELANDRRRDQPPEVASEVNVAALRAELASLRSSTSWKMTAPLRCVTRLARRLVPRR